MISARCPDYGENAGGDGEARAPIKVGKEVMRSLHNNSIADTAAKDTDKSSRKSTTVELNYVGYLDTRSLRLASVHNFRAALP